MAENKNQVSLPQSPNTDMTEVILPETPRENFVLLKNMLISPDNEVFDQLRLHLQEKICDGNGETLFDVGVGADDSVSGLAEEEYEASVATLKSLADTLDADCVLLREKKNKTGTQGQYLVRKKADAEDFMEVRVAVVGNVDAGKSTLLGVLTHGELDNGRGTARMKLFRHKHEMETGRTSSVGNDILGFDSQGKVVNKPDHGHLDWVKICEASSKVITFIDLAGHERYLKTTVFGMTGHLPDFTMLMVSRDPHRALPSPTFPLVAAAQEPFRSLCHIQQDYPEGHSCIGKTHLELEQGLPERFLQCPRKRCVGFISHRLSHSLKQQERFILHKSDKVWFGHMKTSSLP
nr:GTP-binding protein 1-like [Penaeus vannamei]